MFCKTASTVTETKKPNKSLPPCPISLRLAIMPIVVKKASISTVCKVESNTTRITPQPSSTESTNANGMPPTTGLGTDKRSNTGMTRLSHTPK